jgi:hypothetical protein
MHENSALQALLIFLLGVCVVILFMFLSDPTTQFTYSDAQDDSIKIWQTQVYSICSVFIVSLLALTFLIKK